MRLAIATLFAAAIGAGTPSLHAAPQASSAVSITRLQTFSPRSGLSVTAGRFTMDNMPLTALIAFAYEGEHDELRGAPTWLMRDRYSVNAVVDAGLQRSEVSTQIRSLLQGGLGLTTHIDVERNEVLALMRILPDRPLIGLHKIDIDCADPNSGATGTSFSTVERVAPCGTTSRDRTVVSGGESMTRFAGFLTALMGSKVVDMTGLDGYYAYTLKYSPDLPGAEPATPEYPSIRSALRQQLGLMLMRREVVNRVLVIDHIERPTEN